MIIQKKYLILLIIFFIFLICFCFRNKEKFGLAGHDLLCNYKLIDHQHEIIPNLWLGDYKSSQDIDLLKKNNIQLIINLIKNLDFIKNDKITKYRIPIHDNLSKESNIGMINHFDKAYKLIDDALKNKKGVLIHCRAGIQRSATLTALYLMKKRNITSENAKQFIKSKRCIAFFYKANFQPVLNYYESIL